jgi:hypothetical protein
MSVITWLEEATDRPFVTWRGMKSSCTFSVILTRRTKENMLLECMPTKCKRVVKEASDWVGFDPFDPCDHAIAGICNPGSSFHCQKLSINRDFAKRKS